MSNPVKVVFSAEVNAALAAIQGFHRNVLGVFAGVAQGVASALSVRAMIDFVASSINVQDQAGKTAQKLGLTTEAFSAYAYAAEIADVEQGEFTVGMKTLAQQIADAARGQVQAIATFQRLQLGITNADGSLRKLDEVLPEIADRFQSLPDGIEKTDLAVTLFGRSGIALIPLLNEGSAGLARMRQEAQAAGKVISGEAAVAADEFNDTLTRVRAQVAGLGLSLASELLPYLQAGADRMLEFTANAERKQQSLSGLILVLKGVAQILVTVAAYVNLLGRQIGINLALGFEQIVDAAGTAVRVFKTWYDTMTNLLSRVIQLGTSVTSLGKAIRALATGDMAGFKLAAGEFRDQAADAIKGLAGDFAEGWKAELDHAEGYLKRSATRAGVWWDQTKDNVLSNWGKITGTFSTLFGEKSIKPAAAPRAPGTGTLGATPNLENDKQVRAQLDAINREYQQAFLNKSALLTEDYTRELSALDNAARLRDQTLADEQVFERARFQLRETYAQRRAELQREFNDQQFNLTLADNDNALNAIRGDSSLDEGSKLQALLPLLNERNELLTRAIQLQTLLAEQSSTTSEQELAAKQRINQLLNQQLTIQQEVRDRERAVNNQRLDGTRTMFSNMAETAKAFGKEGFLAYKAFAIATATVDTARAAIGAYAAMVSIPYVGPVLAVIAAAAAVGAGAAQIAAISSQSVGYERGGLVAGGEQFVRINERGPEFVVNAAATARHRALLEAINSGRDISMPAPFTSSRERIASEAPGLQPGGGGAAPNVNVQGHQMHVVMVRDQSELRAFMESNAGKNIVIQHVRDGRGAIGMET
jgi:hypothetical protein